jgi:hypothetical protein
MASLPGVIHFTVASGSQNSAAFDMYSAQHVSLAFPLITSCAAYIETAFATAPTSFYRMQTGAAGGHYTLDVGSGWKVYNLDTTAVIAAASVRVAMGVAQSSPVTLTWIVRT